MYITTRKLPHTPGHQSLLDQEEVLITSLHKTMVGSGVSVSQVDIANVFVALKSKPLAILVGPSHSGKIALLECMVQSIVQPEGFHIQLMSHPYWAEKSDVVASHTKLHERFSTEKILALIEEAALPENAQRVFIASFNRISPSELLSFFTEVSFQLQHSRLMRIGDVHLSEPMSIPPNLFIIGTMDTMNFDWWDEDLLLSTTVIQWPQASVLFRPASDRTSLLDERDFLRSCIRGRDSAYRKVFPFLRRQQQPLYPLLQIEAILQRYASSSFDYVKDEVMIYLANSWSRLGNGLFHTSQARNLAIALDFAIAQFLLPHAAEAISGLEELRKQLENVMNNQFPRSTAFVKALALQG